MPLCYAHARTTEGWRIPRFPFLASLRCATISYFNRTAAAHGPVRPPGGWTPVVYNSNLVSRWHSAIFLFFCHYSYSSNLAYDKAAAAQLLAGLDIDYPTLGSLLPWHSAIYHYRWAGHMFWPIQQYGPLVNGTLLLVGTAHSPIALMTGPLSNGHSPFTNLHNILALLLHTKLFLLFRIQLLPGPLI